MDSPGSQGAPRFSSFNPPAPNTSQIPATSEPETRRHRPRPHRRADQHGSPRIPRPSRSRRDGGNNEAVDEERKGRTGDERRSDVKPANEEGEIAMFVVDIKGDRGVTRYGVDKYEAPTYRRSGSGSVLGLPDYRIEYETRHADSLLLLPSSAASTIKPKPLSAKAPAPWSRDVPIRVHPGNSVDTAADFEHAPDFISTAAPPQSGVAASANPDDEQNPYLSICNIGMTEEEATTESSNGDKASRIVAEAKILHRNAELHRAVAENPHDLRSWLLLAEHQELAALGAKYDDRPLSHAEQQLVARDKLYVYDKAIKANPENPDREYFVLRRMEEGAKVWDVPKLTREWEEVLCYHSEFINLWIEYLDYCQTDAQDFQFDSCFKSYVYCLKLHSNVGFGPHKAHIRAYLLLRLTLFLRESGHMELAVGLWQAVLEFVIFRPDSFSTNKKLALEEFKSFWVPEYTKIGESNWQPWNRESGARTPPNRQVYSLEADLPNLFGSWASAERERMIKHRMPSHSFDESKEDEAYRVVLLEDCTQILVYFWDLTDGLGYLVDGFLQFCHLPQLTFPANMRTSRLWAGDSFLRNEYMDDPQSTIAGWINFHQYCATTTIEPFSFPHHTFIHTTDTLFADPQHWFSAFTKWAATTSQKSSIINSDFVLLTLYAFVETFTDSYLAEYAIALSFACNNNLGKRYGKLMLKDRSSDLRLYNAVALTHWRIGDHEMAYKVWSTALTMSRSFDTCELIDSVLLWNSWIWELLNDGQNERASYLLQAMPYKRVQTLAYDTADDFEFNNTNVIRLKRFLASAQEDALEFGKLQAYTKYTDCYALTRYLMGASLQRVLEVYDTAIQTIENTLKTQRDNKAFGRELVHQARARLMYHYVTSQSGQFKPADVRKVLLDSIDRYPHNTMFLSLFKWNDARLQLTHRTRDIFDVTLGTRVRSAQGLKPGSMYRAPVTTHLFNIYSELGRPLITGSTAHSIRGAFERAIIDAMIPAKTSPFELASSTAARSNVTLWKLYLLFELYGECSVRRAREVYFRAVRACPWSKEVFLLAFEHLRADLTRRLPTKAEVNPAGFTTTELRPLYVEMRRRGLRVHYPVEDFWAHQGEESEVS
ncbi:hypothetical protein N7457_007515 [Penicillium paradoxum]|uniref:uncharacterized protein n=1 Tax=Penicillium paradoxum TaxID=176176 RepID=UPI002546F9DD|nr:uncharacterized protein N7457_007515 [Penicillium paradoxum]KAJ5779795.1 hypothetical protein N7457_007515 [Penicillium paradoxum]